MLSQSALSKWASNIQYPLPVYGAKGSSRLNALFSSLPFHGITLTAPGFYAPQGRQIRMKSLLPDFLSDVSETKFEGEMIGNIEMETAAYYAFAASLGHEMISLNAILANRITHEFSKIRKGKLWCLLNLRYIKLHHIIIHNVALTYIEDHFSLLGKSHF